MEYPVTLQHVPQQILAAARQRTTFNLISKEIGPLLGHAWAYLKEHPQLRSPNSMNVAIYRDDTGAGSIEVGVTVNAAFPETPNLICSTTPAATVATTAHFGPYSQLGAAHQAVRQWCKQHGHETALPYWEIYGHWNDDPAQLRTDILYRIK